jgi:hypothetical protein
MRGLGLHPVVVILLILALLAVPMASLASGPDSIDIEASNAAFANRWAAMGESWQARIQVCDPSVIE